MEIFITNIIIKCGHKTKYGKSENPLTFMAAWKYKMIPIWVTLFSFRSSIIIKIMKSSLIFSTKKFN